MANPFIVGTDTFPLIGGENVFVAKYKCNSMNAVNELYNEESVEVYPNPSNGTVNIKWMTDYENTSPLTIEVYNVYGEKICESIIQQVNNSTLDLSKTHNGVYFLQLLTTDRTFSKKVMIVK